MLRYMGGEAGHLTVDLAKQAAWHDVAIISVTPLCSDTYVSRDSGPLHHPLLAVRRSLLLN